MALRRCPVCGVGVKVENLGRHLRDQHPHSGVNASVVLTQDELRQIRRARPGGPTITQRGVGIVAMVAVVLVLVLVLVAFNPFPRGGTQVGTLAPDFTLTATDGTTVSLAALQGKPVLLEFMDVDCPSCQAETRTVFASLYTSYGSRVNFLSVDVNFVGAQDTDARIDAFRGAYDTPWKYALDTGGSATRLYGVTATPTSFVIDAGGHIVQGFRGRSPGGYADYSTALDRALRG